VSGDNSRMTEIEVIVTDGISQRRVIWVSITLNGIYYSYALKTTGKGGYHTSYHMDGSVWSTHNGVKNKLAQYQPLKSFKGKQFLWNMVLSNMIGEVEAAPPYKMAKLDSAIHIDVRPYKKKQMGIGIRMILLEPKKYSLLKGIEPTPKEMHVYPSYGYPWQVIMVYETEFAPRNNLAGPPPATNVSMLQLGLSLLRTGTMKAFI
jgi:hypothetical protein